MSDTHPVVRRVLHAAVTTPDAPAVEGPERRLTYRRFAAESGALAQRLRAAGVRPGHTVSLRAERDDRLPAALLAVWRLGAVAALIDATLPPARIARYEDIVRPGWRVGFGADVTVERCAGSGVRSGSHILFTSGTTGSPAALLVGAEALAATMDWYSGEFRVTAGDRVAMLGGLGHDPLLRDVFVPLTRGATVVVPPAGATGPRALPAFLREAGITVLHGTPGLLELILAGCGEDDLRGLRLVVSGGAPLTAGAARRLRQATAAVIVNAYGATETPQIASCAVVTDEVLTDAGVQDGAPLGVGAGVAGAELALAGDGDEVIVRSPFLALGYLNGTGRAGRFADCPDRPGGTRAYRTGDRGEPDPNGGIRIVGRLDREMSVNGYRVAPEEIEHAALEHRGVVQARAAMVPGPAGDLLTLSLATGPEAVDVTQVRRRLRAVLPPYAVPVRITVVPAFELDQNHKTRQP